MLYDPFSLFASSHHHRSQAFSAYSFFNIITMDLTNPIEGMQISSPFFNPIALLTDRSPQNKVLLNLTLLCPLCYVQKRLCVENGMGSVSGIWRRHNTLVNPFLYKTRILEQTMERNLPFFCWKYYFLFSNNNIVLQNSVLSQVDNADDDPEYFPDSASQASMDDFTVFSFARFSTVRSCCIWPLELLFVLSCQLG